MKKLFDKFKNYINVKHIKIAVLAVLLLIVLFNFRDILSFIFATGIKSTTEIKIESASVIDSIPYKNGVLAASPDKIEFFNKRGNSKWSLDANMVSPLIERKENYIVSYDQSSKQATLIKNKNVVTHLKAENTVLKAVVNKRGLSGIITNESGYKALVNVYDKKGNNIYKWYSGKWYITDICLSDNNKHMAVSGIDTENENVSSVVTIFDMSKEEPVGEYTFDDALTYKIKYLSSGVVVLTDKAVTLLDKKGRVKREYHFGGKAVSSFDFDDDKNLVVTLSGETKDNKNETLMVFSPWLRVKKQTTLNITCKYVDWYKGKILCSGSEGVVVLGAFSRTIFKTNAFNDTKKLYLIDDGYKIAAFSGAAGNIYSMSIFGERN